MQDVRVHGATWAEGWREAEAGRHSTDASNGFRSNPVPTLSGAWTPGGLFRLGGYLSSAPCNVER